MRMTNTSRRLMYAGGSRVFLCGVRVSRVPLSRKGDFDLQPGGQLEIGHGDIVLRSAQVQMLKAVGSKNFGTITVHGKLTEQVLRQHGIEGVEITGCPSLMINRRRDLGLVLGAKYSNLGQRMDEGKCKIGIMLPKKWAPRLIHSMLSMAKLCSGGAYILSRGASVLPPRPFPFLIDTAE